MGLYVKKDPSTSTNVKWPKVTKIYVKKALTGTWATVNKAYVKISQVAWAQFWPTSLSPASKVLIDYQYGTDGLITLTGTNYHWSGTPTLTYDFQSSIDGGNTWTSLITGTTPNTEYGPLSITNPSNGSYNQKTFKVLNSGFTFLVPDTNTNYQFVVFARTADEVGVSISDSVTVQGPTTPALSSTNSSGSIVLTASQVGFDLSYTYYRYDGTNWIALATTNSTTYTDSYPQAGDNMYQVKGWTYQSGKGYDSYLSNTATAKSSIWYCLTRTPAYYPGGIRPGCSFTHSSTNTSGNGTGYSTYCQLDRYPIDPACPYTGSNPASGDQSGYGASTWWCTTYSTSDGACSYNTVANSVNDPSAGQSNYVCGSSTTYPYVSGCGGSTSTTPAYGNRNWYCTGATGTYSNGCTYQYYFQTNSPSAGITSTNLSCSNTQYPSNGLCPSQPASVNPPAGGTSTYYCTTYTNNVPYYSCSYGAGYSDLTTGLTQDRGGFYSYATSCYLSFSANYPSIGGCNYPSGTGYYNPPTYGTTTVSYIANGGCVDSSGTVGTSGTYYMTYTTAVYSTPYYYNGIYAGTDTTQSNYNFSTPVQRNGYCNYSDPWWCVTSVQCAGIGNCSYSGPFTSNQSASGSGYSTSCFQSATKPDLTSYCASTNCYQYYCTREIDSYPYYDCYYVTQSTSTKSGYTCQQGLVGSNNYPTTTHCTYPNQSGNINQSPYFPYFPYFPPYFPYFPGFGPMPSSNPPGRYN